MRLLHMQEFQPRVSPALVHGGGDFGAGPGVAAQRRVLLRPLAADSSITAGNPLTRMAGKCPCRLSGLSLTCLLRSIGPAAARDPAAIPLRASHGRAAGLVSQGAGRPESWNA